MRVPGFRGPFWRVFPWNRAAGAGEPFTPEYVLPAGAQTGGRFDLGDAPTLYLALDDPAHAVAEVLQDLRGRRELRAGHLRRRVRGSPGVHLPLAIVPVWVAVEVYDALPDLGDPPTLARLDIRPDDLSSRDRTTTQAIARALHDEHRLPGFRWWSAFRGEWHVAVLFMDRIGAGGLRCGKPDPLHLHHPIARAAAAELRLRVLPS